MFALKQINLDLVGLKSIWYSPANSSQVAIIPLKLYRDGATNATSSAQPKAPA